MNRSSQIDKNTSKELTKEERSQFGNLQRRKAPEKYLLVGFLVLHYLPSRIKGEKNFDIPNLINDKNFNHIRLDETEIHRPSLREDDIIPQIFRGHFISHKLYLTAEFNRHDYLSGLYQHGGNSSITTGNIIVRRIYSVIDN